MPADPRVAWRAFWTAPTSARNLAAARIVLAVTALWIVLSRDLPAALQLPQVMWAFAGATRFRFAAGLPFALERLAYLLLHVSLVATILGVKPRVSAFVSGLLLYHFAPFESLIWTPNPYLRGLTIPTLGLLVLSSSPELSHARLRDREGEVARWPVTLVQVVLVQMYFFAGVAKLMTSGLAWASAVNMRRWLLILAQIYGAAPSSVAYRVADSAWMTSVIGWMALAFELSFPAVLFSSTARRTLVPLAALFHLANIALYHIVFQDLAILLLFVDWPRRRPSRARL